MVVFRMCAIPSGEVLTEQDLEAVRDLFLQRRYAKISNWKERKTDYCMWFVSCADIKGSFIMETGDSLAETIYKLLGKVS